MGKSKSKENLELELQQSFDRWDSLYKFGGSDPFWSDGVNLNLVRNHIFYYKTRIEESYKPEKYPAIYQRQTPAEVPNDYMARADEIRENAKHTLELYKQDKNYLFLLKKVGLIDPKEEKRLCVRNITGYVSGLEEAIVSDNLISMRRHQNPESYLESFRKCACDVRDLKPPENEQLSFFSPLLQDEDEETDLWEEEDHDISMV